MRKNEEKVNKWHKAEGVKELKPENEYISTTQLTKSLYAVNMFCLNVYFDSVIVFQIDRFGVRSQCPLSMWLLQRSQQSHRSRRCPWKYQYKRNNFLSSQSNRMSLCILFSFRMRHGNNNNRSTNPTDSTHTRAPNQTARSGIEARWLKQQAKRAKHTVQTARNNRVRLGFLRFSFYNEFVIRYTLYLFFCCIFCVLLLLDIRITFTVYTYWLCPFRFKSLLLSGRSTNVFYMGYNIITTSAHISFFSFEIQFFFFLSRVFTCVVRFLPIIFITI